MAAPLYQRPPITRAVDPNRMNWVWKLVSALADVTPADVVAACAAAGIVLPRNRVKAWGYGEASPDFSAMNASELERTLRALIAHRRAEQSSPTEPVESQND
jgi:uncharacterized protein YehS (DUF1456 family)